jgi:hypothetical protein
VEQPAALPSSEGALEEAAWLEHLAAREAEREERARQAAEAAATEVAAREAAERLAARQQEEAERAARLAVVGGCTQCDAWPAAASNMHLGAGSVSCDVER